VGYAAEGGVPLAGAGRQIQSISFDVRGSNTKKVSDSTGGVVGCGQDKNFVQSAIHNLSLEVEGGSRGEIVNIRSRGGKSLGLLRLLG